MENFFEGDQSNEQLNSTIQNRRKQSGGNYDAMLGYIKNFEMKAREDGGYDCTTEIIAHGEILESLKSPLKMVPKVYTDKNIFEKTLSEGKDKNQLVDLDELESIDSIFSIINLRYSIQE